MSDNQFTNDSVQKTQATQAKDSNPFVNFIGDLFGPHKKAEEKPLSTESQSAVTGIEALLNRKNEGLDALVKNNEKDAGEALFQVWDRSTEHNDQSKGNFADVVKKLEEDTKNQDIFHQIHAKRSSDGSINKVIVGLEIGDMTHVLLDSGKALQRHIDGDKSPLDFWGLGYTSAPEALNRISDTNNKK